MSATPQASTRRSKTIPLHKEQPKTRKKRAEFFRKLHRYVGIGALIFLSLLAVSGFLLNHPGLLGAPSERTLSFAVDPRDPQHLYRGTRSALYSSENGGKTWIEVPMLFAAERAVDIAYAPDNPDHIYVVLEDLGLIRSTDGGIVWEQVGLGFMPLAEGIRLQRIGIGSTQNLNLWTSGGLLTSSNGGKTWASIAQSTEARTRSLHDHTPDSHRLFLRRLVCLSLRHRRLGPDRPVHLWPDHLVAHQKAPPTSYKKKCPQILRALSVYIALSLTPYLDPTKTDHKRHRPPASTFAQYC